MKITFLGTGAAEGIPAIGCSCDHCQLAQRESRVRRDRISLLFEIEGFRLLVETPPDIRGHLLRNGIRHLDALFVTHDHYDHSSGVHEFQHWPENIDVFCEKATADRLSERYNLHLFENLNFLYYHPGSTIYFPQFTIVPFPVHHVRTCYGLLVDHPGKRVAYTSDSSSHISNYTASLLRGVDMLIMNTPFFDQERGGHVSVLQALELNEEFKAKQLVLTHINHFNKDYRGLVDYCGKRALVSYDGLVLEL